MSQQSSDVICIVEEAWKHAHCMYFTHHLFLNYKINLCWLWGIHLLCFINFLTPWSTVLLEKLIGYQLVKKFPALYETWRFITTLTSAHHLSLSCATAIQSMPPHPTSWRFILILFSHLCLSLPSGLLPSGFLTKTLYTPLIIQICATCSTHLILSLITWKILGEEYRSVNSLLFSVLHSTVTLSLLGQNILLYTLFLDTLSLRSSLKVSDQVSHPSKTTHKIIVLCTLTFRRLMSTIVAVPYR